MEDSPDIFHQSIYIRYMYGTNRAVTPVTCTDTDMIGFIHTLYVTLMLGNGGAVMVCTGFVSDQYRILTGRLVQIMTQW